MLGYAVVLEAILLIVRRFEQHGVRGVAIHTHDFAKYGNKTKQLNAETIVNGEVLVDARVQTGIFPISWNLAKISTHEDPLRPSVVAFQTEFFKKSQMLM